MDKSKISQYQTIWSQPSSTQKVSWKVPSLKKGLKDIFDSYQVVNEADESQNEDSILRKSSEQHNIQNQDSSLTETLARENPPNLKIQDIKVPEKTRYEEEKYQESLRQSNWNLVLDTSMRIKHQDSSVNNHLGINMMSGNSRMNSLNSKYFSDPKVDKDDEVLHSQENDAEVIAQHQNRLVKKSFDDIPMEVMPKNQTKISLLKKEMDNFREDDDWIILNRYEIFILKIF